MYLFWKQAIIPCFSFLFSPLFSLYFPPFFSIIFAAASVKLLYFRPHFWAGFSALIKHIKTTINFIFRGKLMDVRAGEYGMEIKEKKKNTKKCGQRTYYCCNLSWLSVQQKYGMKIPWKKWKWKAHERKWMHSRRIANMGELNWFLLVSLQKLIQIG